jgi:mono/diheme cytochrome c family protein
MISIKAFFPNAPIMAGGRFPMKVIAALAVTLLFATPAIAQDVEAGQTLAKKWCAGCHDVSPAPKVVRDNGPPPFAVVANSKAMTQTALEVFLQTPHGRMPDYSLTRKEIADVSAYIVSLKK